MITSSPTLFRYVSGRFIINFLGFMAILLGIIFVLDLVELMRRVAGDEARPALEMLVRISMMKLPYLVERTASIGILFSAIYTCWKLNQTSELVVMRAAGLSAWQFLTPLMFCAVFIGVFLTTVINPVSAFFYARYEQMEKTYIEGDINMASLSKTGIWLRQPVEGGYALINAQKLDPAEWKMQNVIVLFFDNEDNFIKRMDGVEVSLVEGYWQFEKPLVNTRIGETYREGTVKLPTELTSKKIEESFASPETVPFWGISEYIRIMKETGLSTSSMQLYFHKLISQPLLFLSLILLSAVFSLRPQRMGNNAYLITAGVAIGFAIFFMESFLSAFGMSHKIPIVLAAWSPSIISMMVGITLILHLEDG